MFLHQTYTADPPQTTYYRLMAPSSPVVGSPEFVERLRRIGVALRASGVRWVRLVHGTFAGLDAWGILSELERIAPSARDTLARLRRQMIHALAGDRGNFTPQQVALLNDMWHDPQGPPLDVQLFDWSSENHHLGRADGAVRLLDHLAGLDVRPGERILLCGHSHGGNVFAILSQLLGGEPAWIEQFFSAAEPYYRTAWLRRIDVPAWQRVRDWIPKQAESGAPWPLDVVTLGTPIRYGWAPRGTARLMHYVFHRPDGERPDYLTPFPPTIDDVMQAAHGDSIQQWGIAGTNSWPSLIAWRTWSANRRLGGLLQAGCQPGDLISRLRVGQRVPQQGETLLIDYGPQPGGLLDHIAGHGIYTQTRWLLFQFEELARRWYGLVD